MDEFSFISQYLSPLAAKEKGALKLRDDAAVLAVPSGHDLVVTKDALTEGVHFIGNEAPGLIARKLLRVNLSDLAAMGAKPRGYFLALMLPESTDEKWLAAFAGGLKADQKEFGIALMGGDTTRTKGTLSLSLTALGLVPKGKALKRSGAKAGQGIFVTGTVGDAALGLQAATHHVQPSASNFLVNRYQLPQPRIALGQRLRGIATACIDVSDGVVQDLEHICEESRTGAEINWEDIPLSREANAVLAGLKNPYESVLAGGDDYELLFTAPLSAQKRLAALAQVTRTPVTLIGRMIKGRGTKVLGGGREVALPRKGWRHF